MHFANELLRAIQILFDNLNKNVCKENKINKGIRHICKPELILICILKKDLFGVTTVLYYGSILYSGKLQSQNIAVVWEHQRQVAGLIKILNMVVVASKQKKNDNKNVTKPVLSRWWPYDQNAHQSYRFTDFHLSKWNLIALSTKNSYPGGYGYYIVIKYVVNRPINQFKKGWW